MERNANYALVGLISTILLIAMIVFIFWLANFAFSAKYDTYHVVFHGPVSGLTRGGDVQFNGIKVGEVSDITPRRPGPQQGHRLRPGALRHAGAGRLRGLASSRRASPGVNYIQLTAGTVVQAAAEGRHRVRPAAGDPGQARRHLVAALRRRHRHAGARSRRSSGSTRCSRSENIQKVTAILSDVQAVTAELRERKAIIADADKALQDADTAAVQIKELAKSAQGLVDTDGKRTLDQDRRRPPIRSRAQRPTCAP